MHKDPPRNLAHNKAMENFSFTRFGCCDSATSYVEEIPLSELIFQIPQSLLKSVSYWKLLFPKETLLEEMSKLPAEWWGLARCFETAGYPKTQFVAK